LSVETREKIMNSSKSLFSENGYAAVTTKEIAKSAEISEVTLYRYFDSKRSLFNAIIKEHMHNYGIATFIEKEATYDVRTDLNAIAERFLGSYKKNGALLRMVIKDAFLKSEARTHSKHVENTDIKALRLYFESIKEKGLVNDDAEKLMKFFISNIHSYAMKNYILKQEPADKKHEEYLSWLINKIIDTILM